MLRALIAAECRAGWARLERILSGMDDCKIEWMDDEEAIKTRLLRGDVDVYFEEYEAHNSRVHAMGEFIRTFGLNTTLATLAEPKNYAAVFEDQNKSINICLLKPVQEETVLFFMQRIVDRKIFLENKRYEPTVSALLNRTIGLMRENFWRDLLDGRMVQTEAFLSQAAQSVKLGDMRSTQIFPILFVAGDNGRDWRFANHKEIFESMAHALVIRENEGYTYYVAEGMQVILFHPYDPKLSVNRIVLRCYQYCEEMKRQFGYVGSCIVGEACAPVDLTQQWKRLNEKARSMRFRGGKIFFLNDKEREANPIAVPQVEQWGELITEGKKDGILAEARHFFEMNQENAGLTTDFIVSLSYEINRSVTISMSEKGIYTKQRNEVLQRYFVCADSVENFLAWIAELTEWCLEQVDQKKKTSSVLDAAVDYIKKNLSTDLKRQAIADHVHVSQNYLARLFREKMGTTISEYIVQERMCLAERLLSKTSLPITEVALHSGFTSQTYFSSCFKKCYNTSPRDYRKREKA